MGSIADEVLAAQQDRSQLDQLISNYLPFIKKQLAGLQGMRLEYDDMLSLAMLTFTGCVQQYALDRGNFLAFCSACIRNRLIDESRKQTRYERKIVPLFDDENEGNPCAADQDASIAAYNIGQEQASLAQEIECFSLEIQKYGIDFSDLPRICPKQARSRALCVRLARGIIADAPMYHDFMATRRIAQSELSARFAISPKTIEKHRKFIVTLVVLMAGDFPYIQAFLPGAKEAV